MPRTSRSVAQRLASQNKSRKRRISRAGSSVSPEVEQILDDAAPTDLPRAATVDGATVQLRRPSAQVSTRVAPTRRRYSEYAGEYRYVWGDLQRISLVAGGLFLLLLVLSFFIS